MQTKTRGYYLDWLRMVCITGFPQIKNIDGLLHVSKTFRKAVPELSAFVNLSSFYENIKVANKALAIASKQADFASVGMLYSNMGLAYYFIGKFDSTASVKER